MQLFLVMHPVKCDAINYANTAMADANTHDND